MHFTPVRLVLSSLLDVELDVRSLTACRALDLADRRETWGSLLFFEVLRYEPILNFQSADFTMLLMSFDPSGFSARKCFCDLWQHPFGRVLRGCNGNSTHRTRKQHTSLRNACEHQAAPGVSFSSSAPTSYHPRVGQSGQSCQDGCQHPRSFVAPLFFTLPLQLLFRRISTLADLKA